MFLEYFEKGISVIGAYYANKNVIFHYDNEAVYSSAVVFAKLMQVRLPIRSTNLLLSRYDFLVLLPVLQYEKWQTVRR